MTTLKRNVRVLSVDGNFDDCQRLVKRAFLDQSLSYLKLSSANSINIGRLLPQSVYYFWGWLQVAAEKGWQAVFSVPCGNLGNLAGGLIAKRMGLPAGRFIISTNENDEVEVFLKSGKYEIISPSRNCISSAMNVGNPSNLARIIALYGGIMDEKSFISRQPGFKRLSDDLYAVTVSDEATRETIKESYRQYRLLLEPHGAVAWKGLQEYLNRNIESVGGDNVYISLETAHPAKFPEEISDILKIVPDRKSVV